MRTVLLRQPSGNIFKVETRYYFRQVVPIDLRARIGRTEFKYSLRTSDKRAAKHKAGYLSARFWALFTRLRKEKELHLKPLTKDDINRLAVTFIQEGLDDFEAGLAAKTRPFLPADDTYDEGEADIFSDQYSGFSFDAHGDLAECNYERIRGAVDQLLEDKDIEISSDSNEYRTLSRELLKASILLFDLMSKRVLGDYDSGHEAKWKEMQALVPSTRPIITAQNNPDGDRRLSDFMASYADEKVSRKSWTKRTAYENIKKLELVIEIMENPKLNDITQQSLSDARNLLYKYPKNKTKSEKYRKWSLDRVRDTDIPEKDCMGQKTLDGYCAEINGLFRWIQARHNGATWLSQIMYAPKRDKNEKTNMSREVFTEADIEKIFHNATLEQDRFRQPSRFWMPLLGLFTGARTGELTQLFLCDFQIIDGVKCIVISELNDKGEKVLKHIKNPQSNRRIPIHPQLLNLGLWQYVEELKKAGKERLFEEFTYDAKNERWGRKYSERFSSYLYQLEIHPEHGGTKSFYSFRHTFLNNCVQKLLNQSLYERVVGHIVTDGGVTVSNYAKDIYPATLLEVVIMKVHNGVDVSHLKKSKFARPNIESADKVDD